MAGSIRPIFPTNRMCWPRRMLPCVPSWCAGTFLSMVACWPVTGSSRDFRPLRPSVATRAATRHLGTAPTATAVVLAIIAAAAPLLPSIEGTVAEILLDSASWMETKTARSGFWRSSKGLGDSQRLGPSSPTQTTQVPTSMAADI